MVREGGVCVGPGRDFFVGPDKFAVCSTLNTRQKCYFFSFLHISKYTICIYIFSIYFKYFLKLLKFHMNQSKINKKF